MDEPRPFRDPFDKPMDHKSGVIHHPFIHQISREESRAKGLDRQPSSVSVVPEHRNRRSPRPCIGKM
jgi:hypothetical protein